MPDEKNDAVTINGISYPVAALKIKHLKQITEMLAQPPPVGVYAGLERWFPFITDSIQAKTPSFTGIMLDDATMDEINNAWTTIVSASGITIVNKTGESKPAEESTGKTSTGDSQPPSATPTVQ